MADVTIVYRGQKDSDTIELYPKDKMMWEFILRQRELSFVFLPVGLAVYTRREHARALIKAFQTAGYSYKEANQYGRNNSAP